MITELVLASGIPSAAWGLHASILRRRLRDERRCPVTGLQTRSSWTRRARKTCRKPCTVILLDLDKFKQVNDTHGHAAGDIVLRVTAERMISWTNDEECGRLGGDEFVIITRDLVAPEDLDQLVKLLSQPVALPGGTIAEISASIGVHSQTTSGALSGALAAADLAMYQAKGSGGVWRESFFTPAVEPAPTVRTRNLRDRTLS